MMQPVDNVLFGTFARMHAEYCDNFAKSFVCHISGELPPGVPALLVAEYVPEDRIEYAANVFPVGCDIWTNDHEWMIEHQSPGHLRLYPPLAYLRTLRDKWIHIRIDDLDNIRGLVMRSDISSIDCSLPFDYMYGIGCGAGTMREFLKSIRIRNISDGILPLELIGKLAAAVINPCRQYNTMVGDMQKKMR